MTDKQPEALRLADRCEALFQIADAYDPEAYAQAATELRRLHAENERLHQINQSHEMKLSVRGYELQIEDLLQANEAFGKRQEWWNERMFELEKQREELLEALKLARLMLIAHGETHAKIDAAIAKVKGEKK